MITRRLAVMWGNSESQEIGRTSGEEEWVQSEEIIYYNIYIYIYNYQKIDITYIELHCCT